MLSTDCTEGSVDSACSAIFEPIFLAPTAIAELISAVAREFPSRRHPALTDQSLHEGASTAPALGK